MAAMVPFLFAAKSTSPKVAQTVVMVIDLLVLLGVVVDPTTEGISDSAQAMAYEAPKPREISKN